MRSSQPGELRPGSSVEELSEAIRALQEKIDLLTGPTPITSTHGHGEQGEARSSAFMIMPFGPEDLQVVYEDFLRPTLEARCLVTCVRADDIFGSGVVMDDVQGAIQEADIVVADLTGQNANVFYEVGIAHAVDKPVLLLAQSLDDVPFDLRHRRILIYEYSPRGCKRLTESLESHVLDMLGKLSSGSLPLSETEDQDEGTKNQAASAQRESPPATTSAVIAQPASPDHADLVFAWSNKILLGLSPRAKSRLRVGHFASIENDVAVLVLPNAIHRDRCDEVRSEAEKALSAHFGRDISIQLVVGG